MRLATIVDREKKETRLAEYRNTQGATITTGYAVCLSDNASSVLGKDVVLAVAATNQFLVGVAAHDIPDNGFGWVIEAGYAASVWVYATGTSVTTAAGVAMGCGVAGSLGFNSTGNRALGAGLVMPLAAVGAATHSPGGYVRGFVRIL